MGFGRLFLSLVVLLCVACSKNSDSSPSGTAKPIPVRVGIAIPSYVHAVAWIGKDAGYFEKQGLDVKVEVMGGSAATMRTLIAGKVDVGLAGGDAALKATAAGADLVVLAGLVNRFYHRLVVHESITNADQLRGKTIGLPFLGGPQDMAVKVALKSLGLSHEKDVKVVSLGKEFNRMAALSRGEIHATTSQTPAAELQKLGVKVLVDLPAQDRAFPYMALVVTRDYLAKNRRAAKSFIEGLCAATAFYKAPKNREQSLAIIAKYLRGSDARGAADTRYRQAGPGLLSLPPRVEPAAFETVRSLAPAAVAKVPLDKALDSTLLDELVAEGGCPSASRP